MNATRYTDFSAWEAAGLAANYNGPLQAQGWSVFQFVQQDQVLGVWDGAAGFLMTP